MTRTVRLLACVLALTLLHAPPSATGADAPKKVKIKGPRAHCTSLAFSPDATLLAASYLKKGTFVFDSITGKKVFEATTEPTFGVAFGPEGKKLLVLTGRMEMSIEIWDVDSHEQVRSIDAIPVSCLRVSMAVSPDGRHAVVCGADKVSRTENTGAIHVVGLEPGGERRELETKLPFAPHAAFTPDGKLLFIEGMPTMIGGSPGAIPVRSYDPTTWAVVRRYGSLLLRGLSFAPDGSLFYGGLRGGIEGYETSALGEEPVAQWKAHGDHYPETACSHDGALVASWTYNISGKNDPWLCVFDAASGRRLKRMKPDPKQVTTATFSPKSRRLAIGGETSVKVYDLSDLKTAE